MPRVEPLPGVRWRADREIWEAQVVLTYKANGQPEKRLTKTFALLENANDWKRDHDRQKARGDLSADAAITLAEWSTDWLEGKKRAKRGARTLYDYAYYINKFIAPQIGHLRLTELRPLVIKRWLDRIAGITTQGATIKARNHLSMILEEAARLELIPRNPVSSVRLDKPARTQYRRWTQEEAARVITTALEPTCANRVRYFVTLALMTALRREELLGLRWADIDWELGALRVQQVVIYIGGCWTIKATPKNLESVRTIYVDAATLEVLRRQAALVSQWRDIKNGPRKNTSREPKLWQEHDLVFPSLHGTPFNEGRLRIDFNALCVAARVPQIRVYDTRATFNSIASLDLRLPPKLIADRMGHMDERTQQQFYQRVNDADRRGLALSWHTLYGLELPLSSTPAKHGSETITYSQPTAKEKEAS